MDLETWREIARALMDKHLTTNTLNWPGKTVFQEDFLNNLFGNTRVGTAIFLNHFEDIIYYFFNDKEEAYSDLKILQNRFIEKIKNLEDEVNSSWSRVIERVKSDLANQQDSDPDDMSDEDVFNYYKKNRERRDEFIRMVGEECSTNLENTLEFSKYIGMTTDLNWDKIFDNHMVEDVGDLLHKETDNKLSQELDDCMYVVKNLYGAVEYDAAQPQTKKSILDYVFGVTNYVKLVK